MYQYVLIIEFDWDNKNFILYKHGLNCDYVKIDCHVSFEEIMSNSCYLFTEKQLDKLLDNQAFKDPSDIITYGKPIDQFMTHIESMI